MSAEAEKAWKALCMENKGQFGKRMAFDAGRASLSTTNATLTTRVAELEKALDAVAREQHVRFHIGPDGEELAFEACDLPQCRTALRALNRSAASDKEKP